MGAHDDMFQSAKDGRKTDEKKTGSQGKHQTSILVKQLSSSTAETLQSVYRALTGDTKYPAPKARLVEVLASLLTITNSTEYETFVARFQPGLRTLMERAVFEAWIPVKDFETLLGPVFAENKRPFYSNEKILKPELRLDLFRPDSRKDYLGLHGWLREQLVPFAPKPEGWVIKPRAEAPSSSWSVAASIIDILPLFRKRLGQFLQTQEAWEIARKGFLKANLVELRKSSGLPAFGLAAAGGLDSAELLARFLALFDPGNSSTDPLSFIKILVERFFAGIPCKEPEMVKSATDLKAEHLATLANAVYEQMGLLDFLSRRDSGLMRVVSVPPPARQDFAAALGMLNEIETEFPGAWIGARDLFKALDQRMCRFAIVDEYDESENLLLRADHFSVDGQVQEKRTYEPGYEVSGSRRRDCLARPVFEQYVYLFATLGLLEISESEPPRVLVRKGKALPICPADCLDSLRLTPLGRWCFGFATERPALTESPFEALADEELLLVTIRGSSLERRLYLDAVATPLGPERWRFTEARFIEGCDSPARIEERIAEFRRLISRKPSERWEAFFAGIWTRASLFATVTQVFRFRLPPDPVIRRVFLDNTKIRALVLRVEDGSVIVDEEHLGELTKLLVAEGFWSPDPRKLRRLLLADEF